MLFYLDQIRTIINDFQIFTFSLTGELLSELSIQWEGKLNERPRIRFARNFNDTLYLACMANNCVLLVDHSGVIKHIAGEGYGRSYVQFTQPAGLTVDSQGNFIIAGKTKFCYFNYFDTSLYSVGLWILFADFLNLKRPYRFQRLYNVLKKILKTNFKDSKSNRFLHFSSRGEPRGQVQLSSAIKRPADCYLTDSGHFYTCLLNGTVRIFTLSKSSHN